MRSKYKVILKRAYNLFHLLLLLALKHMQLLYITQMPIRKIRVRNT